MYFGNETYSNAELSLNFGADDCNDLAAACDFAVKYLEEHQADNIAGPALAARLHVLSVLFTVGWWALAKRQAIPENGGDDGQ